MRKTLVIAALLMLLTSTPTLAVTDGELDGEGHPYVALMIAQDREGNPSWRCSGSLIAPKLCLTAGHCTEAPSAHAEIWFDADVESGIPANGHPHQGQVRGTPYTHPGYDTNAFYLYDPGMVVLKKAMETKRYGQLPVQNELDDAKPPHGAPCA